MTEQSKSNSTAMQTDVVIVGGGMVGATVALGLAQAGFDVTLLERRAPSLDWSEDAPYQARVSALTRASENILKHLNAWEGIERRRCHAFTDMHVWESISDAQVHFDARDVQEPNLGYVVENSVIQAALWEQMVVYPNLHRITGQTLTDMTLENDQAWLELDNGDCVLARLVVGADGALSQTREMAGIAVQEHDYQQCAVVGCVKTELSNQDTCWQRYQAEGPFAYLAMDDNMSSIAWYLPIEKMQWALSLSDEAFSAAITEASGYKLGKVIEVGERTAFPLVRRHAQAYVKPNVVLVGDAAHTVHPQAGQGVNLGLLDAAALVEVLVQAKRDIPEDWDCFSVLRRYERWRRGDNAIVQRSMEGFDWLFEQDQMVKNHLRKGFLSLADQAVPFKKWMMRQALNGREVLPGLAKTPIEVL